MQLSVIIVNFNVKYFLEQCLLSVQKAAAGLQVEVFVVDNNSTDGSENYLAEKFPWVHFKWNKTNAGFGKANNSVLKETRGEYVLFLNPDTIIAEDTLQKCLAFFASTPGCGALGVRMIDGSGQYLPESKRGFPSPLASFYKLSGLTSLFPSSAFFAPYYQGHLPQDKTNEVQVLAGAFMMLSKQAIAATGGFDEAFFMYGEDVDLSYRINQAGLKNYYFAGTSIIHFKGESTQKKSPAYTQHFYGAMNLFIRKHYSGRKAMVFLMSQAIGISKLLAKLTARRGKRIQQPQSAGRPTAVLADQQQFNELLQLGKHATPAILFAGRISIEKNDAQAAIGDIASIEASLQQHSIKQLIFCEGKISFGKIISLAEQLKGKLDFLFHANGSSSIVGSNNSNERGVFIARP